MKWPKVIGKLVGSLKRPITIDEKKKSATEKAPHPEDFTGEAGFTSDIAFLARR